MPKLRTDKDKPKIVQLYIRLTLEEETAISAAAEAGGFSRTEFARAALRGAAGLPSPLKDSE